MMLIGLIIIVAIIYFVFKAGNGQTFNQYTGNNNVKDNRAIEILNEKLAVGEISVEEYEAKKKLINSCN